MFARHKHRVRRLGEADDAVGVIVHLLVWPGRSVCLSELGVDVCNGCCSVGDDGLMLVADDVIVVGAAAE